MHRNTLTRRRARFAREGNDGGGGGQQTGGQAGGTDSGQQTGDSQAIVAGQGDAPGRMVRQGGDQTGQPQAGQQAGDWDGKVESLPEPVQKMIRDLRTENADRRTKLSAAEQAQQDAIRALAKAAGIELPGDQQAPDPAKLTEQLTASQQQARQTAVELAVYRTAGKHTADPDALLDSRAFLKAVENLDPTADDFAATVDTAIKAAVDTNPKLKAGRVPGASGADHTGGTGETRIRTPRPLTEAVAASYGTA